MNNSRLNFRFDALGIEGSRWQGMCYASTDPIQSLSLQRCSIFHFRQEQMLYHSVKRKFSWDPQTNSNGSVRDLELSSTKLTTENETFISFKRSNTLGCLNSIKNLTFEALRSFTQDSSKNYEKSACASFELTLQWPTVSEVKMMSKAAQKMFVIRRQNMEPTAAHTSNCKWDWNIYIFDTRLHSIAPGLIL